MDTSTKDCLRPSFRAGKKENKSDLTDSSTGALGVFASSLYEAVSSYLIQFGAGIPKSLSPSRERNVIGGSSITAPSSDDTAFM